MEQTKLAKEFTDGWKHFLDRIDFGSSHLDADAIKFMNEMPGRLVNSHDRLAGICEYGLKFLDSLPKAKTTKEMENRGVMENYFMKARILTNAEKGSG